MARAYTEAVILLDVLLSYDVNTWGCAVGGSAQGNGHRCPLMHDSVDHGQSSVVVLVLQHDQSSSALSWAPFGAGGGLPSGTNSLLPPSR